jgi:hypothetical protein
MQNKLGKIFLASGFVILIFVFTYSVFANDINVTHTFKNIPLSDTEVAYKDYYLTGKDVSLLKKNQIVTVYRNINIKDATGTQIVEELKVKVAKLKIIQVQSKVAVARFYQSIGRESEPSIEQPGVLVGDKIDLEGAVIDKAAASDN